MNTLKCGSTKTDGEREEKAVRKVKRDTVGYKSGVKGPEAEFGRSQNPYLVGFST